MASRKREEQHPACLLVRVEHPSGSNVPWIFVELGTWDRSAEYPRTPDDVNGLYSDDLCLISICSGPEYGDAPRIGVGEVEYKHAAYVDGFKCERMLKSLRRVNGRMSKLVDSLGCPGSWVEQVGRFASATETEQLGFPSVLLRKYLPTEHAWHPGDDDRAWVFVSMTTGREILNALAAAILAALGGEASHAA